MNISWQLVSFAELSPFQLYAILQARSAVFVMEQNCAYQDMDDCDQLSQHLIAWTDEGNLPA